MKGMIKKIGLGVLILCVCLIATNVLAFKWDNDNGMANISNMSNMGFAFWPIFSVFGIVYKLLAGILMIGLKYLITVLFPKRAENITLTFEKKPVFSTFIGLLAVIGGFITAVILCITIIGIPIGIMMGISIILLLTISDLPVIILLGRRLRDAINLKLNIKYSEVIIGGATLLLIAFVPIVGFLVVAAAALAGFGSMVLSKFGADMPACEPVQQAGAVTQEGTFSQSGEVIQEKKPAKYDSLAIPALVCGILSTIPFLGIIFGIIAIIFGIISIKRIDKSQEPLSGRGAAIAGLIFGIIFVILWFVAAVVGVGIYSLWQTHPIDIKAIIEKLESMDSMKNCLALNPVYIL